LDGIRVQAHRAGGEVRLFTRKLNDVTDQLGVAAARVRSLPADALVLDGESVAGELRFFDCLHVDGEHLVDRPLVERLEVLERVAGEWRVPGIITTDPDESERFLHDAMAARHEGGMVKDAASISEAGRRGAPWR